MRNRFRNFRHALVFVTIFLGTLPAIAQDKPIAFKPAVEAAIEVVILPGYTRLADSAKAMDHAMIALCEAPNEDGLKQARDAFRKLVTQWSHVEMFRFGPVRVDNRYERLFFWPDRKGLGLRQVRKVIESKDATATNRDSLQQKSVAVQGLLALEYVLFGTDSETLAAEDEFRCRYGETIASAIASTSGAILEDWQRDGGYADLMREAGPDDPIYRSHGEVIQQILKSAREEVAFVRNLKLARPLGKSAKAANPKAAPFWRSNSVVDTIEANLNSIASLAESGGINALLTGSDNWLGPSLVFELNQARSAIADAGDGPWLEEVRDEAVYQRLSYALIPLGGAHGILEDKIPEALGLITGFNSLDGD